MSAGTKKMLKRTIPSLPIFLVVILLAFVASGAPCVQAEARPRRKKTVKRGEGSEPSSLSSSRRMLKDPKPPVSKGTAQPRTTSQPSTAPSLKPTSQPSSVPSHPPRSKPSSQPSSAPSFFPSLEPTLSQGPSLAPTLSSGPSLSQEPSSDPSSSSLPSQNPSLIPTKDPSQKQFTAGNTRKICTETLSEGSCADWNCSKGDILKDNRTSDTANVTVIVQDLIRNWWRNETIKEWGTNATTDLCAAYDNTEECAEDLIVTSVNFTASLETEGKFQIANEDKIGLFE
jgi:hypothetical protein